MNRRHVSPSTARATAFLLLLAAIANLPVAVAANGASAAQAGSPFNRKDVANTEFGARALEQEGCPLTVAVTGTGRDERGVTVTLRLANADGAAIGRYTVGVWVLAADGTVRGSQQSKSSKALAAGESRNVDVVLRMITVQGGDTIVAAVQEAAGGTAWRKDQKTLQDEIRASLTPRQ